MSDYKDGWKRGYADSWQGKKSEIIGIQPPLFEGLCDPLILSEEKWSRSYKKGYLEGYLAGKIEMRKNLE